MTTDTLVITTYQHMIADPAATPRLREFYQTELAGFQRRAERRARKIQPPRAFTHFLKD